MSDDPSNDLPLESHPCEEAPVSEGMSLEAFETAHQIDQAGETVVPLEAKSSVTPLPRTRRGRNRQQQDKARMRQETYLQKRREQKRRKVFYSRIRVVFKLLSAMLLLLGLYSLSIASFWTFHTQNTYLHGNYLVTSPQVKGMLTSLEGQPLYRINPLTLAETLQKAFPIINHIYIRRQLFPAGLDIILTEKPAWAVLYAAPVSPLPENLKPPVNENKTDPKQQAPEKPAPPAPEPLYLLHWDNTVTDLANYHLTPADIQRMGHPIAIITSPTPLQPAIAKHLHTIVTCLASHPDQAHLQSLDIRNPYNLIAHFDDFEVHFGYADKTVITRLQRLFSVLPTLHQRLPEIQYVDLRWNQQVIFKKKPKAKQF